MINRMRDGNETRLRPRRGESLGDLATMVDRILNLESKRTTASWSATAARRRTHFLSDLVPGASDAAYPARS